jgi:hypothetical protein
VSTGGIVGSGGLNTGGIVGSGGFGGSGGRGSGGVSTGGFAGTGGLSSGGAVGTGGIGSGGIGTGGIGTGGIGGVKVDAGKGGGVGSGGDGAGGVSLDAGVSDAIIALTGDACAPICTGLVSHWTFDEGSGPLALDSAGTNDGFVLGAAWVPACQSGGCLRFDGASAVQVPVPVGLPLAGSPRTVTLWFQSEADLTQAPDSALVQYGLPGKDGAMFGLITSADAPGVPYFYGFHQDVVGTTPIPRGTWHHAAVVYDGATVYLYIDGNLDASATRLLSTEIDPNGLTIGWRPPSPYNGDARWTGRIDDVRIYSRALAQAELLAF